jgi:hypothetical protein
MKNGDENVEPDGLRQHRLRAFLWSGDDGEKADHCTGWRWVFNETLESSSS